MSSLFMSFIHEEESAGSTVNFFIRGLLEYKIDTFMSSDKNVVYAGEDWMRRILDELRAVKVLPSMLSPISVRRPWINFEAGRAIALDAKSIPVCSGD